MLYVFFFALVCLKGSPIVAIALMFYVYLLSKLFDSVCKMPELYIELLFQWGFFFDLTTISLTVLDIAKQSRHTHTFRAQRTRTEATTGMPYDTWNTLKHTSTYKDTNTHTHPQMHTKSTYIGRMNMWTLTYGRENSKTNIIVFYYLSIKFIFLLSVFWKKNGQRNERINITWVKAWRLNNSNWII